MVINTVNNQSEMPKIESTRRATMTTIGFIIEFSVLSVSSNPSDYGRCQIDGDHKMVSNFVAAADKFINYLNLNNNFFYQMRYFTYLFSRSSQFFRTRQQGVQILKSSRNYLNSMLILMILEQCFCTQQRL